MRLEYYTYQSYQPLFSVYLPSTTYMIGTYLPISNQIILFTFALLDISSSFSI